MWERLEKLELLLSEQQGVIAQLIDFYSAADGQGMVEAGPCMDLIPSSAADAILTGLKLKMGVDGLPDEAFYRSLNTAYRNDLVSHPPSSGPSQLGMIWEEPEEENGRADVQLSSMDQAAIEKLKELDRLTTKLQNDSRSLKELQNRLLCESPKYKQDNIPKVGDQVPSDIDEQISRMYEESGIDNWSYRGSPREQEELALGFSSRNQYALEGTDDVNLSSGLGYNIRHSPSPQRRRVDEPLYSSIAESPTAPKYDAVEPYFPDLSPGTLRTRQDGYVAPSEPPPGSPPPPAPQDRTNVFLMPSDVQEFDGATPRTSPKSPRTSPKHVNKCAKLVSAKSDSGLSSMSGWSSLEKSPGSPKQANKSGTSTDIHSRSNLARVYPSISVHPTQYKDNEGFSDNGDYNGVLPGGHRTSSFTPVRTPTSTTLTDESVFVPPPAPDPLSTKRRHVPQPDEFCYSEQPPAIYSVAGSHREPYFTSVYTGRSNTLTSYPDLIGHYAAHEYAQQQQRQYGSASPNHVKRCLQRVHSTGSVPYTQAEVLGLEGYKSPMYRSMFPTGNITDALTYYPPGPNQEWPEDELSRDSSVSTIRSAVERIPPKKPPRSEEWVSSEEPRVVEPREGYYDPAGVIVSQSGYLTFSSDLKDQICLTDEKKKLKRHATLKHAMSQVSNWLPDLHLHKRHRSYSLPSGVRKEDITKSKEGIKGTPRKKKKHPLVSTMSGILQKAKRRGHGHSFSDPEQSETDWTCRHSNTEDSEDSVFSDAQESVFVKMNQSAPPDVQAVQPMQPTIQSMSSPFTQVSHQPQASPSYAPDEQLPVSVPNVPEQEIEPTPVVQPEQSVELPQPPPKPPEISLQTEETLALFQTVGEIKKACQVKEDEEEDLKDDLPVTVTVGSASREFAVSRALGRYRRRQSSQDSGEEMFAIITQDEEAEEMRRNEIFERISSEESRQSEASTSADNRTHPRPPPTRHQASLDIPWGGRGSGDTDDDNRSTHSWRSTSRVSSRRQSTEDSIDSEDEWYCYELRKLEAMESGYQGDLPFDETPVIPQVPTPPLDESVRIHMTSLMKELEAKIKPHLDIEEERLREEQWQEEEERAREEEAGRADQEEGSSGETSGPDSPEGSGDEMEDDEVLPIEREMAAEQEERRASEYEAALREAEAGTDLEIPPDVGPGTPSLPRFKFDPCPQGDEGKEGGPLGSKWKLLKALKERKAEEKEAAENKEAQAALDTKVRKPINSIYNVLH